MLGIGMNCYIFNNGNSRRRAQAAAKVENNSRSHAADRRGRSCCMGTADEGARLRQESKKPDSSDPT